MAGPRWSVSFFADPRPQRRPGKARGRGPPRQHNQLPDGGRDEAADGQRDAHAAEAQTERREVAAPLRKLAAEPGRANVNQSVEGGGEQVAPIAEAKVVPQKEELVVEIVGRGESVQPFEQEIAGFAFGRERFRRPNFGGRLGSPGRIVQMRHSLTEDEKLALGRELKVDRQSHACVLTLSRRRCNDWLRAIPATTEA